MRCVEWRLLNCWRARWRTAASRKPSGRQKTLNWNTWLSMLPRGSLSNLCCTSLIHPVRSWWELETFWTGLPSQGILWQTMAFSESQAVGCAADWPARTCSRSAMKAEMISVCRATVWASSWTNDISGDGLQASVICAGGTLISSDLTSATNGAAVCHTVSSELDKCPARPLIRAMLARRFLKQNRSGTWKV